jgi:hypothetical protein
MKLITVKVLVNICPWLYSPLLALGRFLSFFVCYRVGRTPWTGDQPVARPLPPHRTAQMQNKRTQISMPPVGFEPTIPVSERAKIFCALDHAATAIGTIVNNYIELFHVELKHFSISGRNIYALFGSVLLELQNTWWFITFQLLDSSLNLRSFRHRYQRFNCLHFSLARIIKPTQICKVSLPITYRDSSKFVKFIYTSIKVSDFLSLLSVSSSLIWYCIHYPFFRQCPFSVS